ncbi:MAG: hypothetical protein AB7P99_16450 [Vicinamibacterales bacterium]
MKQTAGTLMLLAFGALLTAPVPTWQARALVSVGLLGIGIVFAYFGAKER